MNICGKEITVRGRCLRVGRLAAEGFDFFDDPEAAVMAVRSLDLRVDIFTFMQGLPHGTPQYSYPIEWDNVAALPISTFDQWWTKQIGFKARNKAKQAEKRGVILREVPFDENFARGIWEIYNECPIRQGRRFPHYGKDFESVRKMSATFIDRSIFIGAFLEEKLIGFLKMTVDEARSQAGIMHILSMVQHRDKAPTNALIAQAVRVCANRKIPYLVYSNFAYGKKQSDSLSDFKERNGFQRIDLPRYYVPMTLLGKAAYRLGLHSGIKRRLPEPILAKLRQLRLSAYKSVG